MPDFSLIPRWPESLPTHCAKCHSRYDIRSALQIGPGRLGRGLRRVAPWMTVIVLIAMFLTRLEFLTLGGQGGAMAFALAIILPSIVLWVLGGIFPERARLYCSSCGHTEFHRPPELLDNRIPKVDH